MRDDYRKGVAQEFDYYLVVWEYNIQDVVVLLRVIHKQEYHPSNIFSGFRKFGISPGAGPWNNIETSVFDT